MPSLRRVKDILYLRDGFPIFVGHFAIFILHPWAKEDFSGQLFMFLTQIIIRENPCEYQKTYVPVKHLRLSFLRR